MDKERIYVVNPIKRYVPSKGFDETTCIVVLDIRTLISIKRFDEVTAIKFICLVPDKLQLFCKLEDGPMINVYEIDR